MQYKKVPRETNGDYGYQSQVRMGVTPSPGIKSVGSGSNTPDALFLESRSLPPLSKKRSIKSSKSVENLKVKGKPPRPPRNKDNGKDRLQGLKSSNESAMSLPGAASAKRKEPLSNSSSRHHSSNSLPPPTPSRSGSLPSTGIDFILSADSLLQDTASLSLSDSPQPNSKQHRRPAPPAPASKRRKPPAVPIPVALERTNSGATITTIASSNNPVSAMKVMKTSSLKHPVA